LKSQQAKNLLEIEMYKNDHKSHQESIIGYDNFAKISNIVLEKISSSQIDFKIYKQLKPWYTKDDPNKDIEQKLDKLYHIFCPETKDPGNK